MPETQAHPDRRPDPTEGRPDILTQIVRTKRREISLLVDRMDELRDQAASAPKSRDFLEAMRGSSAVALIAEVKRRSPGAGPIRPGLDPAKLASAYADAGAAAISVLTDREYFQGSLDDLLAVRRAVPCPVLRKDFILDEAQVWEARAAGADAILLIVSILEDGELRGLRLLAESLGMQALVEVHDGSELGRALDSGAQLLGINNRDLTTFRTRLETTFALRSKVPDSVTLVSESGIRSRDDIQRLGDAGVHAVLIGETLLRADDPGGKAREFSGVGRTPRADDA